MNLTHEELVEKQDEFECRMRGLGVDRYRKQVASSQQSESESRTSYGKIILAKSIAPVAEAIKAWIEERTGKVGRAHVALKYLRMFDPEVTALLAVRTVLNHISNVDSARMMQDTAERIGHQLEDEARMVAFKDADKKNFERMLKRSGKTGHEVHRRRVMSVAATRSGVEQMDWSRETRAHIGMKLLEIIVGAVGWLEVRTLYKPVVRKGTQHPVMESYYTVVPTQALLDWIEGHKEHAELLAPLYLPMVVRPTPWTNPFDGGYMTDHNRRLTLIKKARAGYLEELANRVDEMPSVYRAINALQDTAWKVNRKVYDVAQAVWASGQGVAKLPSGEDTPIPPKPGLDLDNRDNWTEEEGLSWKVWKREAAETHAGNISMRGKRIHTMKTLWVAEQLVDYAEVFFPYQYDFRGRAYTVPAYLSPQGNDLAKGLLTFSQGKAINTEEAANWLAIHGANVYGFDKASLEDRVAWARENTEQIKAVAADPLGTIGFWGKTEGKGKVDKPWQFLAWCFEWAAFSEQGLGFVSSLPCAMDGSCNGIQIFSLVLRDPIGGRAVNLLPGEKPQDIYQTVADEVIRRISTIEPGAGDYQMAQNWLSVGIDRKVTKRPVMVLPYGGRPFSMRGYVQEALKEKIKEAHGQSPWGKDTFGPSMWLTKHIWEAIGVVVVAARECMDWLQTVARVASSKNLPIIWTTPDGLPIQQAYENSTSRRVETVMGDVAYKLTIMSSIPNTVDKSRQANGVAPNWVHSLDGCALRVTVGYGLDKGVTQYAMVHDSYGTVAADAPTLARELRRAFVDLFTNNSVLERFRDEMAALVGSSEDFPKLPATGTLEVSKVLESDFFFA